MRVAISRFPTCFHLWLLALGVELRFGRLNRPTDQGIISLGRHIYRLGYDWHLDGYAELILDSSTREFICRTPSGKEKRLPTSWLTKQELMGELFQFQRIPFQFALPFSTKDWRALLYEQLPAQADMTL